MLLLGQYVKIRYHREIDTGTLSYVSSIHLVMRELALTTAKIVLKKRQDRQEMVLKTFSQHQLRFRFIYFPIMSQLKNKHSLQYLIHIRTQLCPWTTRLVHLGGPRTIIFTTINISFVIFLFYTYEVRFGKKKDLFNFSMAGTMAAPVLDAISNKIGVMCAQ